ncbi:MAG: sce7726 family protein [Pseudomonadales bacterium]|nr:sce7726 family protein [Pseudomonadales bacterium]
MNSHATALDNQQLAATSRLFSSKVVREFAKKGKSATFARLVGDSALLKVLGEDLKNVSEVFDSAFNLLKRKNYRHEYIYKAAIAHRILLGKHSLNTAVLLNEFRTGKNKADSVILNGTSSVYEIKSERDSLKRLDEQISSYRRVFATVNVIVAQKHLEDVVRSLPSDVGIFTLSDRYQISEFREAQNLPDRTCALHIFDSIQLQEARIVLERLGVEVPKVPNTKAYHTLKSLFSKLSSIDAHNGMVEVLKETRSKATSSDLINSLPISIQPAVLSVTVNSKDHSKLLSAMSTPVCEALKWN